MSLNPRVGHLYHDGNISNAFTVLDAKEKMKTREINAREAKQLDKYSGEIDRAKRVCKRQNEWEQSSIRKHLESINSKTPSLANSLRRQSELVFSRQSTGVWHTSCNPVNGSSLGTYRQRTGNQREKVNVSSCSVYSHLVNGDPSRRHVSNGEGNGPKTPLSKYRSWKYKDNCDSAKTENLVKRADQVTKSLHGLYTRSFERKWREKGMTVLDILNKNSRDELQKALFVLRGTPTGEAIEDILRAREHVSKPTSEKDTLDKNNDDKEEMLKLSDDIFVTKLGETVVKPLNKEKSSRTYLDRDSKSTLRSKDRQSSNGGSVSSGLNSRELSDYVRRSDACTTLPSNWDDFDDPLTVREVFERDDSFLLSSMLANPSEADTVCGTNNKWRDIFKAPELWKQGATFNKEIVKIKPVSVVTLTGKYRQTMLK